VAADERVPAILELMAAYPIEGVSVAMKRHLALAILNYTDTQNPSRLAMAKLRDRWNRAHDLVHRFFPLVRRVIDAAKGEAEWPDGESADQSFTALSDEWDEIEKGVDPSELATDVATLRAEEARLREVIAQATSGLQRWCDGYYQGPSLTQILAILKEVSHD
jgi:hypothetical protein